MAGDQGSFLRAIWSLSGSRSFSPHYLHRHPVPLSPTGQCCKRKGEEILKPTWAKGKGNASKGHRRKLRFSSLPHLLPLLLLFPLFPPPVMPFSLFPPSKSPHLSSHPPSSFPTPLSSLTLEPCALALAVPGSHVCQRECGCTCARGALRRLAATQ